MLAGCMVGEGEAEDEGESAREGASKGGGAEGATGSVGGTMLGFASSGDLNGRNPDMVCGCGQAEGSAERPQDTVQKFAHTFPLPFVMARHRE